MTFALTKIQAPRPRAQVVLRQATRERLAEALATRRAVLLCAPAGYGKTTVLAHGLSGLPPGHAAAWISADPGDDLPRLLECMLAALESYDPPWRTAPETLVQRAASGSAAEVRAVAMELVNTLHGCEVERGVIVLDDLHRVEDAAFFQFLEPLLERLDARWGLALGSRTEPPLPLARLRAAGDLAEFGQLELQLARDEARELAAAEGLDAATADRLFDRTHGWPAGIRMAMGALRAGAARQGEVTPALVERALRAGERPMVEFIASEVLDQLPADLAEFLLWTSVLTELDAERCNVVSGRDDADAMLDAIEHRGLFVDVLEAPVRTLRLHDLFRDALQGRLRQRDPEALAAARRRAAEVEPDAGRRVALLLAAGEGGQAAREAYRHGPALIAAGGPAAAMPLLRPFAPGVRERLPELAFLRGQIAWVQWDFPRMRAELDHAESAFFARGDVDDAQLARAYRAYALVATGRLDEAEALLATLEDAGLRDDVAIIALNARAALALDTGRLRSVPSLLGAMLNRLERIDAIELWHNTTPPNRIAGVPGIGPVLARHAELMLRVGGDAPTQMRPLALLCQAWAAAWRGERAAAEALMRRAQGEADWSGSTGAVHGTLMRLRAVLHAIAGEAREAVEIARQRARDLSQLHFGWGHFLLHGFNARIAAAVGDLAALREALAVVEASHPGPRPFAEAPRFFALRGVVAALESRPEDAVRLWEAALQHEDEIDELGQVMETHLRLAAAQARAGSLEAAARHVDLAIERSRREGWPGGALLAREAIAQLAAVRWGSALDPSGVVTLRGWAALGTPAMPAPAPASEGLTTRELEVLQRIAAGESNKLIARALDLSLHTVKRHVANILGKLGVETRGQAAAWFRQRSRS